MKRHVDRRDNPFSTVLPTRTETTLTAYKNIGVQTNLGYLASL